MTVEEAKNELKQYQQNCKYIEYKKMDIAEQRARAKKTTSCITASASGHDPQSFEKKMVNLIDLQNRIEEKVKELEENRVNIEKKISSLEQPYCNVLYFRHIKDYSIIKIGMEIGVTDRQIKRIYRVAIKKYAECP